MNFTEKILLLLSRDPESSDFKADGNLYSESIDTALDLLHRSLPDFPSLVRNKRIADFGCGFGYQSCALVKHYNAEVIGIDSNQATLEIAIKNAAHSGLDSRKLNFVNSAGSEHQNSFDLVISQNSFEHFSDPASVLETMKSLIKPEGKIIISFGPPWYAPYGAHMHFFTKVPWVNLIFSEKTIMHVRSKFRHDGAEKFEDVESGLNRMSVRKFEKIIQKSQLQTEFRNYRCVKNMQVLQHIPFLREMFINHVSVVLRHD
jgi:ubiquinone/menaquinone biosynthesis C-methylase UbiE